MDPTLKELIVQNENVSIAPDLMDMITQRLREQIVETGVAMGMSEEECEERLNAYLDAAAQRAREEQKIEIRVVPGKVPGSGYEVEYVIRYPTAEMIDCLRRQEPPTVTVLIEPLTDKTLEIPPDVI